MIERKQIENFENAIISDTVLKEINSLFDSLMTAFNNCHAVKMTAIDLFNDEDLNNTHIVEIVIYDVEQYTISIKREDVEL